MSLVRSVLHEGEAGPTLVDLSTGADLARRRIARTWQHPRAVAWFGRHLLLPACPLSGRDRPVDQGVMLQFNDWSRRSPGSGSRSHDPNDPRPRSSAHRDLPPYGAPDETGPQ